MDFNPRATRGATIAVWTMRPFTPISIHAPHGVRPVSGMLKRSQSYFNPRATRGATQLARRSTSPFLYFNPRATRGATSCIRSVNRIAVRFQSTRHTGCDYIKGYGTGDYTEISIHAPHGVRQSNTHRLDELQDISIHAPHGVRHLDHLHIHNTSVFQSTRHTGCDWTVSSNPSSVGAFQSTRHTGCDGKNLQQYPKRFVIDEYCFILNCTI